MGRVNHGTPTGVVPRVLFHRFCQLGSDLMADTAPRLPSASDDTIRYAPLSWMGMAAFAVAVLFVLLTLIMGFIAYTEDRSLLSSILLALPLIGLILAFVAKQAIKNAEGAVTGIRFVNAAWWICLVGGACYGAYWLAVDWSVRSTGEKQLLEWTTKLIEGNPTTAQDPNIKEAFLKTLPPANAEGEFARNPKLFDAQFALPLQNLRNSHLLLIAHRNRGAVTIETTGMKGWEQNDKDTIVETTAKLRCPEGEFPLTVPITSTVANKSRVWQVNLPREMIPVEQNGRPIGNRTRYGWMLLTADMLATRRMEEFLESLSGYPSKQPADRPNQQYSPPPALGQAVVHHAMIANATPDLHSARVALSTVGRLQAMGGLGALPGDPSLPPDFVARADGKPMSEQDRATLSEFWFKPTRNRLLPPGQINPVIPIKNNILELSETELVVKVPFEAAPLAQPFVSRPKSFCIAWLVLVCDDKEVLAELNAAKKAGGPLTDLPPQDGRRVYPFKVRRIESDLMPIDPPNDPSAGQQGEGPG